MKPQAMLRHWVVGFFLTTVVGQALATSAPEYTSRARHYLEAGDDRAAVIELKNALQRDPDAAEARLLLGRTYLRLEEPAGAAKELERARDLGANAAEWAIPLGKAYLALQQPRKSLDEILLTDRAPPALQAQLHALRSEAWLSLGNPKQAEEEISTALALAPEDPDVQLAAARGALSAGERETASIFVAQALAAAPDNSLAWLMRGELSRLDGKLDEAMQAYAKAVELDPREHRARLSKAAGHIALGQHAAARTELDALPQDFIPARYLRGQLALQTKDYEVAVGHLEWVLRAWPDHRATHLALGTAYYAQGRIESADPQLSRYVDAVPQNVAAAKLLAAVRLRAGDADGAIDVLDAARAYAPEDPQLLAQLGNAYQRQGDYTRGTRYLEQAAALVPDVGEVHRQLAVAHLAAGDVEQALGELETAVELDPKLWQAEALRVMVQLREADFDAALAASQSLTQKYPDSATPHHLAALAHVGRQDEDKARAQWERALALAPGFTDAQLQLARLDIQSTDYPAAQRRYQAVLEKQPDQADALLGLAELADRRGEHAQALGLIETAWAKNPGSLRPGLLLVARYRMQGKDDKALAVARELEQHHPDHPKVLYSLGAVQFETGSNANALASFEKLARVEPDDANSHAWLGRAYLRADREGEARASFEQALQLQHDSAQAHVGLAVLDLKAERFDGALKRARKLQELQPDAALGYQLEGDVHSRADDAVQAARAYEQAYERGSNAKVAMSVYRAHRHAGHTDQAIAALEKWLEREPGDTRARLALAGEYHGEGRTADAIREYERLTETWPDNPVVWNNLAWAYDSNGDQRSLSRAEQAYALAPKKPEIADTFGWMHVRYGDAPRGLGLIREAVSYAPHKPEIRYHLAFALHKVGRDEEANKELARLLRSNPQFPDERDEKAARDLLTQLGGAL